jgi:hypothetical protein
MTVVIVVAGVAVWRSGLPGLAVTGPIVAFATSIPAWFPRVFPDAAARDPDDVIQPDAGANRAISADIAPPQLNPVHSPSNGSPIPPVQSEREMDLARSGPGQREVGSSRFADLVYALSKAIPDQARIIRAIDLAGLDRGIIEEGFIDASTRWYAALRHAVESDKEEALCREALRASPSKALRAAVAAYLG